MVQKAWRGWSISRPALVVGTMGFRLNSAPPSVGLSPVRPLRSPVVSHSFQTCFSTASSVRSGWAAIPGKAICEFSRIRAIILSGVSPELLPEPVLPTTLPYTRSRRSVPLKLFLSMPCDIARLGQSPRSFGSRRPAPWYPPQQENRSNGLCGAGPPSCRIGSKLRELLKPSVAGFHTAGSEITQP